MEMAAAHGATIALCALATLQFVLSRDRGAVTRYGALFTASVALGCLNALPGVAAALGPLSPVLVVLTSGMMAVFWWFAQALLDDRFRLRPWHLLPWLACAGLAWLWLEGNRSAVLPTLSHLLMLAMFAHLVVLALRGLRGDLVNSRRRFRLAVAIGIPAAMTGLILLHSVEMATGLQLRSAEAEALITVPLAFVFVAWLTRMEQGFVAPLVPREASAPTGGLSVADRLDLRRIEAAAADGLCLESGLTIGGLAVRLGLPEHRARKLINQGLGYRNFADFLNAHRIAEAEARLSDPALAREQIIAHAFALGYNSLAPFNRAFRARTGLSPTEYRSRALAPVAGE